MSASTAAGRHEIALDALPALWRADAEHIERYGPSPAALALRTAADQLESALGATWQRSAAPASDLGSSPAMTWRERLWVVPADTRLGVVEVTAATGRSRGWLYRRTGAGGHRPRIPHRKLDGQLVFTAGEVRDFLRSSERVISEGTHAVPGPSTTIARRHRLRVQRSGSPSPS